MKSVGALLKKNSLWFGFLAVLVPLGVLLTLQYRWLTRLEEVSEIAHRSTLNNYLEAVGNEIQFFYRSTAERVLSIPSSYVMGGRTDEVAKIWARRRVEGVGRLFLVDFTRNLYGHFLVYDPDTRTLVSPPASDESMAMIVASTPWQFSNRGSTGSALSVDERDPAHRIILSPIVDDTVGVVGVAGMILDQDYFEKTLLPRVIRKMLPEFFPSFAQEGMVVIVKDSRNIAVMSTGSGAPKDASVQRAIPFVFSDWRIEIFSTVATPEQWARTNFGWNIGLALLLAAVLMAGVFLAFRFADRAMRLSDMKSEFISNVSHELKTPLASIRVFAELLRLGRARTPERVQAYGGHIETEARRLSSLIDNILDFSRIESGRKTYRFAPTDVAALVAAAVETFRAPLAESGFALRYEPPGEELPEIPLDAAAIDQALSNLVDNAVKYSGDAREVIVRVTRAPRHVVVSVSDRGIGIPKQEHGKVFERFHRVGTNLVHDVKGSGLGLSIVRHIVEAHHGKVTVDSQPGAGSTFSMYLPVRAGEREPSDAGMEAPTSAGAGG